jgi:ribosomal protein L10
MTEPEDSRKVKPEIEENGCDYKVIRNTILFSIAAIAAGSAIYYVIKENKKLKRENELLEYEIWG